MPNLPGYEDTSKFMNEVDEKFRAKVYIELPIFFVFFIYFVPSTVMYIRMRDNQRIKYRQPLNVISASILCTFNSLITPFVHLIRFPCILNTWFNNPLIFGFVIITLSRYVRAYYMQKLSIFKLKFTEKKKLKNTDLNKTAGSLRLKESALSDAASSHDSHHSRTGSGYTKNSSVSNDPTESSLGIGDPVIYFKKLNNIINRKITIYLVIIPYAILFVHSLVITIQYWNGKDGQNSMKEACVNDHSSVGAPKMILNVAIMLSSIFFFYQAYYKQKWDKEIKIEYTIFVAVTSFCAIMMQLVIRGKLGETIAQYRPYIFQIFNITIHGMCVIEPLCRIYRSSHQEKKGKMSQEEFLNHLSDSTFKAHVKEIANHTFCIENILFFESYCDLMNMVISFYNKKTNSVMNENSSFVNADVMHKNTINQALYKPFELIFKSQYEQIYNLYIKEDGIASINIKSSTLRAIEEQMSNDNYTYLMFSQAAEEIGELLYNNIYPKMKL